MLAQQSPAEEEDQNKIMCLMCLLKDLLCEEEEEVGELQIPLVYCKPRMRIQREEQRDPGRKEDAVVVVVVVVVVMVVVMHILLCPLLQTWFSQAVLGVSSSSYRKKKKKNG